MNEQLLTTKEVANYFKVKETTVTQKFIKMGLKYIPIGKRDYRYSPKDVEEFAEHLKELAQYKLIKTIPIKRKTRSKKINFDLEKRRINLEQMKVV